MKIAIIKLSALGDIVHCASVLQFLKAKVPDLRIDWFVEKGFAPILEHNPHIDAIRPLNLHAIKRNKLALFNQIKLVRSYADDQHYDLIIDAQGLIKSAIVAKLLGTKIAGFDKKSIRESVASYLYSDTFAIPYHENTIDRYRLLFSKALRIEITPEEMHRKAPYLHYSPADLEKITPLLKQDKPTVFFIIGANWESRIYPKEKLLEVAQALDADILVPWGNESEKKRGKWLEDHAENVTLLPKLDLNALKAIISQADLLIGNDTGPSYIAWANNIPAILLFGPTPVSRIYQSSICRTLKSPSTVDPYRLNKEDFSISEIDPQTVITEAQELLNAR